MTRKMKDSGVEWIGEIPEDWEVVRLKNVSKFSNGYAFKESNLTMKGNKYVIRIGNFQDNKLIINTKTFKTNINDELLKNYKIQNGDILIAMSGATVGKVIYLKNIDVKMYINQRVGIIRSQINKLLKYYFLINGFQEHIYLNSQGSAQPNISETDILNFNISLPSNLEKQKAIAGFLDEKTGQIDNIISKTKKAIEEYKKYKQSLITETVTKGLDENVEMKDSGIEWIGEIPEHWDVVRLKYLVDLTMGQSPNSESYNKDKVGIDFLQGNKDFGHIYPKATEYTTSPKKVSNKGDILFSVRAPVGARNISDKEYAIGRGLCSLTAVGLNKSYLWYWMDLLNVALKIHLRGSTYDSVTIDDINNSFLLKVPMEEQEQIASYLDKKTNQINQIISTKEKLLTEMEAYKKSLIYEVVTGKREVR